jgi:hypothetical protein
MEERSMETTMVSDRPPATPEEIWAILREAAEMNRESEQRHKELDRFMQENAQRQKEIDLKFERLQENLGGLNRSLGELIEIFIAAHLWEKFPEYDLQRAYRRIPIYDEKNQVKTDIDILLVNTEWAMVVEVKSDVDNRDIEHHIERMARVLKYPPALLTPQLKVLGAMAGGVVTPEAAAYAHECGFFVLELAGESVVRVPAPAGFKPKEWQEV